MKIKSLTMLFTKSYRLVLLTLTTNNLNTVLLISEKKWWWKIESDLN